MFAVRPRPSPRGAVLLVGVALASSGCSSGPDFDDSGLVSGGSLPTAPVSGDMSSGGSEATGPTSSASATADASGPGCGDGVCDPGETCQTCPADCTDCGDSCGDGVCDPGEGCVACPGDCPQCGGLCGNGVCDPGEACVGCPGDCPRCAEQCGNGVCNPGEACVGCPGDCPQCEGLCGNGVCDPEESCESCPGDCPECPANCPDGTCDADESCQSCALDCPVCPVDFGDPFFAISGDAATWGPDQLHTLRDLGAGMVRIQLCNWPQDQAWISQQVDDALAAKLRVYAELNYCLLPAYADTNAWHAGFKDDGNEFAAAFAGAAGELAAALKGKVYAYEIWNEPDPAPRPFGFNGQDVYWAGPGNADWEGACGAYAYGTPYVPVQASWGLCPRQLGVVTTNAFMAIKGADPDARVVAGNLLFHGEDAWVAKEYWAAVEASPAVAWHRANKGGVPWDIVGIHPYGYAPPGPLTAQIEAFAAVLGAHADPAPLAITEYGWNTVGGDPNLTTDEATQADHVLAAHSAAKSLGLAFLVWFNYLDGPDDSINFGLRRFDMSWKPGGAAYCQATATASCPVP